MAQKDTTGGMAGMAMPGMDMGKSSGKDMGGKTPAANITTAAQAKTSVGDGAGMSGESMQQMPMLTPKRVWTATGTEDWDMLRGFGAASGMVAMMYGMMVGGSPMQHMKMGKMDMSMTEQPAPSPEEARKSEEAKTPPDEGQASASAAKVQMAVSPDPPVVGDNTLTLTVKDTRGQTVSGLTLGAAVAMVSMDMGTAKPPVTDLGGGRYQIQANFRMAGPWRVTVDGGGGAVGLHETYTFDAGVEKKATQKQGTSAQGPQTQPAGPITIAAALSPHPPKVGSANVLTLTVTDSAGQTLPGAKVSASVAMTTMDMGTTHPSFKDLGTGKYQGKVGFAMAGPWRVTVKVTAPGHKAQSKTFEFNAK